MQIALDQRSAITATIGLLLLPYRLSRGAINSFFLCMIITYIALAGSASFRSTSDRGGSELDGDAGILLDHKRTIKRRVSQLGRNARVIADTGTRRERDESVTKTLLLRLLISVMTSGTRTRYAVS